uniref:Transposase n=1 Tax=Gongylonema pulchrum TaxID=637853 RepID=A0A183DHI0_9BILA
LPGIGDNVISEEKSRNVELMKTTKNFNVANLEGESGLI